MKEKEKKEKRKDDLPSMFSKMFQKYTEDIERQKFPTKKQKSKFSKDKEHRRMKNKMAKKSRQKNRKRYKGMA